MSIDIPYSIQHQHELIRAKVKSEQQSLQSCHFGEVLESDHLITTTQQVFAVFDDQAFEVSDVVSAIDSSQLLYTHANVDGKSFYCCPDDGRGGILTWLYLAQRSAWTLCWCTKRRVCAHALEEYYCEYKNFRLF